MTGTGFLGGADVVPEHHLIESARSIRGVLVEHARKRVGPSEQAVAPAFGGTTLLQIDAALTKLAVLSPQWALAVELRVFGRLSVREIAPCLGVSRSQARRLWGQARRSLNQLLRR